MIRNALVLAGLCGLLVSCRSSLPIDNARTLGAEMLLRAADPRNSDYQVGLVNTQATSAILLPLAGAPTNAGWITGADGAVWSQVARQLADGAGATALHADVMRYVVTEASCDGLDEAVADFHAAFAQFQEAARIGYDPLPPVDGEANATSAGPAYVIQYAQGEALVRLTPTLTLHGELHEASNALYNFINSCGAADGFRDRIQ